MMLTPAQHSSSMISFLRRPYGPLAVALLICIIYLFQIRGTPAGCIHFTNQTHVCNTLQAPIPPQSQLPPVTDAAAAKPTGSNHTRTLVIARMSSNDVSWISESLPLLHTAIYTADDPAAPLHPPLNKGHEAMIYLTYLIDFYDSLADITIFMHDHQHTWHNERLLAWDALEILTRLSTPRVLRHGYMNLRCSHAPGCPAHLHPLDAAPDIYRQEQAALAPAWRELFPGSPVPVVLAQACCAQFAVSRERVRAVPRAQLEAHRAWLRDTPLSDYISGRVFEYVWQVIFARQPVFCPVVAACFCDGYGICLAGGDAAHARWDEVVREADEARQMLEEWEARGREVEVGEEGEEERPPFGADVFLRARIEALEGVADAMKRVGVERGRDPEVRALAVAEGV